MMRPALEKYEILVSQESRLRTMQQRTLRRLNPSCLPQEMATRKFLLYDSQ